MPVTLCVLMTGTAQGDFYRYTGEDGVVTFTNTPTSSGAVRIMREAGPRKMKTKRASTTTLQAASDFFPAKPMLPVNGIITSRYGLRQDPIDGGTKHHNGIDIAVPTGTSVKAVAAGRVIESGSRGGYGNLVTIEHGGGMLSRYGHNSHLEVSVGDQVEAGETVALSGSTGRSTGPHVHFELWRNGANITWAYLENGAGIPEVADSIRSYLHKDGSLVFTNLN